VANPPAAAAPPPLASRDDHRLLLLLLIVPVVCACSARDLWAPDEPRYGQVAREMQARGDWLVPHANGEPYAEKPPVYWWGVLLLSSPRGEVTAATARLGGALYALGCILLVFLLTRRWFGDARTAVTAAALFASMVFVWWNGQRAGLDMPLTFWVLLSVERGEVWLRTGRLLPAIVCGLAWAAAILTKGPLGFLFPPMALAAGAIAARRAPSWRNPGWLLVPAVMAGACLAWLLPALEAGGQAYEDRLLGQIKGRATGAEGHHVRPVYYYLYNGAALALPWSMHLLAGFAASLRIGRAPRAHRRGLGAGLALGIGGFVLLSAFATKRQVYLVPLLPFVSAVTAYAAHQRLFPGIERLGRWVATGALVVFGVGAFVGPLIARRVLISSAEGQVEPLHWSAFLVMAPAALACFAGAWAAWRAGDDTARAARRVAFCLAIAGVVVSVGFLPYMDGYKSYAPAAEAAERHADGGPVYNAGFGQAANLLWSLDRERTPTIWVLSQLVEALPAGGPRAVVVAEDKWWDRIRASDPEAVAHVREVWREPVDHRGLVVLSNRPD
jgi:4-amino-4-deoxy-L-arabinose transferase-like glycosyltransferase